MYVKQLDKNTMTMAGTKERFNMLKRVGMCYKVTADDCGKTIAFKKGFLWWRRYIPIYITSMYIGYTGWDILYNKK
jgi:hypothetical protein